LTFTADFPLSGSKDRSLSSFGVLLAKIHLTMNGQTEETLTTLATGVESDKVSCKASYLLHENSRMWSFHGKKLQVKSGIQVVVF